MNDSLKGKIILITGGAAGIGRATAALCAQRGGVVTIADLNEDAGAAAAQELGVDFRQVDVTDEASVRALCSSLQDQYGRLDVLIHAAGVLLGSYTPLAEFELATWRKVLDVNLTGTFLCAKHTAPLMQKAGGGVMVLVSSGAAVGGSSSFAYGSSKGGVNALALTLRRNLESEGVRVNVVMPGDIDTGMKRSVLDAAARKRGVDMETLLAQSDLGDPAGVARVLAWLASDDADYVRGVLRTR